MSIIRSSVSAFLLYTASLAMAESAPLFDLDAIRDPSTLEITVLEDWKPSPKDPSIKQKLIEVTVCEWWPGQKVRLPVTLNVPADSLPCRHIVVANQGLANKTSTPSGGQLELLKKHGVGIVLIGMGTIDAMKPAGQLHLGMKHQLLETKDVRYTAAWIWGMSQMRALTAALTEPKFYELDKVLTTGGSKRGVAAAVAGIHDERFTAIMPVVAPPLGNPGSQSYVIGTDPEFIAANNKQFFSDLESGKLDLDPVIQVALEERSGRRASTKVTLEQAREANWSDDDIETITDRIWSSCRIAGSLSSLKERGLEVFYNVGTNDSVTPSLVALGETYPDFPICIIPGGQHGGPATAGYTRRTPTLPEVQDNFLSFALHHFFDARAMVNSPELTHEWNQESNELTVVVKFGDGTEPDSNTLWWSLNRSRPYTLAFEYDTWESTPMIKTGEGHYEVTVPIQDRPMEIDLITQHTHIENNLPLTLSSRYAKIQSKR